LSNAGKGRFTIKSAGALFILSAVFELLSLTSAVPLFGAIRSGPLMVVYHTLYIALFLIIGLGLWIPKHWGFKAAFAGASFYTLDKVLFLLESATKETYLVQLLGNYREIQQMIDTQSVVRIYSYTMVMSIACWWGFVLYLYLRREYFSITKK
jgi:hypothetical protein